MSKLCSTVPIRRSLTVSSMILVRWEGWFLYYLLVIQAHSITSMPGFVRDISTQIIISEMDYL
ncbi:hypothetical protein P171DRAFT_64357 [Karstenula rhodostoma CBS 690.94]|uniref:Uncharacterized protein n=1 Tax=Karstenula rhodostoma CBS 690.94 TaxID=1392251 RepID=A0A9P4PDR8_9PLEO|nr:hypothetical protein P171DRAFT_64357 [Karstenula rhodostoma CBS 690.94]